MPRPSGEPPAGSPAAVALPAAADRTTNPGPGHGPPHPPEPDSADCRDLYARLASGVCVVTTDSAAGPVGATVSSVTSLSLSPPLLLSCFSTGSRTLAALRDAGTFAVHLLRAGQRREAELFADPAVSAAERFARVPVERVREVPVLAACLARSVCRVQDTVRYGDHCVVIGRVVDLSVHGGRPLLWHGRTYHGLLPDPATPAS